MKLKRPMSPKRSPIRAGYVVHAQLLTLIPAIVVGRCEIWGYSRLFMSGVLPVFFGLVASVLLWSAYLFPFAVLIQWTRESPPEKWSIAAIPLSIALSFAQLLALLPLVQ